MRYLLAILPILLSACIDSVNVGIVEVEPETRACPDSSLRIDTKVAVRRITPRERETGGVVTKWIWE